MPHQGSTGIGNGRAHAGSQDALELRGFTRAGNLECSATEGTALSRIRQRPEKRLRIQRLRRQGTGGEPVQPLRAWSAQASEQQIDLLLGVEKGRADATASCAHGDGDSALCKPRRQRLIGVGIAG